MAQQHHRQALQLPCTPPHMHTHATPATRSQPRKWSPACPARCRARCRL
jgi:hypothetical protein